MAERLPESGELAVDELRRKARRRLVGAIVLALAAAIIVPMLLEDEPRPLGDDVSVQIPPLDQGKFVNRLTGAAPDAKSTPKQEPSRDAKAAPPEREAKPAPADADAKAPPHAESTDTSGPQVATRTTPAATQTSPGTQTSAATGTAAGDAEAKPAVEARADVTPAAKAAQASAGEGFVVQLAAFSDDKGANALANKLKRANYAAYVEPVATSRGTLWRVRVGGFTSRPDADAARAKLKDEGYSGIVATAK